MKLKNKKIKESRRTWKAKFDCTSSGVGSTVSTLIAKVNTISPRTSPDRCYEPKYWHKCSKLCSEKYSTYRRPLKIDRGRPWLQLHLYHDQMFCNSEWYCSHAGQKISSSSPGCEWICRNTSCFHGHMTEWRNRPNGNTCITMNKFDVMQSNREKAALFI